MTKSLQYALFYGLAAVLLGFFQMGSLGAQTIHLVIAVDGRGGFGANLATDFKNMNRVFKENVPSSQLDLVAMDTDEITPDSILEAVNKIKVAKDDTFVFYYSGHAANDKNNGGQYLQLKDKNGKTAELQRRTLLAALREKSARLTVLLSDCCNIELKSSGASKEHVPVAKTVKTVSPLFEALFIKPEGVVDLTSSKVGEASFVDSTGKKRGSCFTWPLVELLEKNKDNASITWKGFVSELSENVQKAFRECWPDGYKITSEGGGSFVQKFQTVDVYGTLPGETGSTPQASDRGPRFGVRATNHSGGGVRITELFPKGPGQRAGFEVGDIIIEINGTAIRTEQDYSNAIDESPKNMKAKIINVNDGQTMNVTCELGYWKRNT